jgi:hypothetical protein
MILSSFDLFMIDPLTSARASISAALCKALRSAHEMPLESVCCFSGGSLMHRAGEVQLSSSLGAALGAAATGLAVELLLSGRLAVAPLLNRNTL